jgi:hypothetical protein
MTIGNSPIGSTPLGATDALDYFETPPSVVYEFIGTLATFEQIWDTGDDCHSD